MRPRILRSRTEIRANNAGNTISSAVMLISADTLCASHAGAPDRCASKSSFARSKIGSSPSPGIPDEESDGAIFKQGISDGNLQRRERRELNCVACSFDTPSRLRQGAAAWATADDINGGLETAAPCFLLPKFADASHPWQSVFISSPVDEAESLSFHRSLLRDRDRLPASATRACLDMAPVFSTAQTRPREKRDLRMRHRINR